MTRPRPSSALVGQAHDPGGRTPREDAKPPAGKPAYVGMALALKAEHATFEVFVPAAALGQIYKLLQPMLDKAQ